jgi:hypothetical protein
MEESNDFQDIAEQRAILESIRLQESEKQLKTAMQLSLKSTQKPKVQPKAQPKVEESDESDESDESSSDSINIVKPVDDDDIFEDFSDSDVEEPIVPKSSGKKKIICEPPGNDLIKKIKDELRAEIMESLKNEAINKARGNKVDKKKK